MNNKRNNIILIGFMGSGKTTLGKWISDNKNMKFIDTDECIENKHNRKIKEIFSTDGEKYFRNLETELLRQLVDSLDGYVISVGGGLPVRSENRVLLKQLGKVVYLRTSQEELVRRLKSDTDRPLLKGGNLEQKISDLMDKRQDLYIDASDIIVDTDNRTFEDICSEILNRED